MIYVIAVISMMIGSVSRCCRILSHTNEPSAQVHHINHTNHINHSSDNFTHQAILETTQTQTNPNGKATTSARSNVCSTMDNQEDTTSERSNVCSTMYNQDDTTSERSNVCSTMDNQEDTTSARSYVCALSIYIVQIREMFHR